MLRNPEFNLKHAPEVCRSRSGYDCASGGSEIAVTRAEAGFVSGGGFATYGGPMPRYQQEAVQRFSNEQEEELPPASYFNSSHRGYPDIAAVGNMFLMYMNAYGNWSLDGGTSASTPLLLESPPTGMISVTGGLASLSAS